MSGNPFRRIKSARLPEHDDEGSFGGDAVVAQRNTQAPSKRKKKKKVVTIQTPPHSPEEPRRLSAGRLSPPPPPRLPEDDVEDSDSTATADSDLEQALRNTRRNSGPLAPPGSILSQGGAPYNPFARTLATNEAAFGLQRVGGGGYEKPAVEYGRDIGNGSGQNEAGRPAMDVDQFKNILLTGSAVPSPPSGTPATTPRAARFGDSSSSTTTTSSVSMYEPYLDAQQETPRSSFDHMGYPSDSSDGEDEESSGLMSGTERLDDFAPPAPPKHSTKGPQTVSFADFDETITQGAHAPFSFGTSAANGVGGLKPQTLHRSMSDLNKPLPPPPQEPVTVPEPIEPRAPTVVPLPAAPMPSAAEEATDTKKPIPPPPPTARRVGQSSSTGQTRDRSTSNPRHISDPPPQPKPDDPSPKPPPPPPTRKIKASPQPPSAELAPTTHTPSPAPSATTSEPKNIPPPPPLRRMGSKAGGSVVRTSSTASRSSAHQRKENGPSTTSAPVPPPPPRRGGKRESVEVARPAAASPEAKDERAVAKMGGVGGGVESQSDILADMTAFQAEIDALRARAGGQG